MIEIICNQEDDDKKKKIDDSVETKKPKNIKQIGEVDSDKKIYIEDYAYSYIDSIVGQNKQAECAGVLLGECKQKDDETFIFIKGVVKSKFSTDNGNGIYFDKDVWDKIYVDIEKFFPGLKVVGWFAVLPEVNQERMSALKKIHIDNFAGNIKTLYLINMKEKESAFYLYEKNELIKQNGFVCFYERNYEMQEYMLKKRGRKSCESNEKDEVMSSIRKKIEEKQHIKQKQHIQVNVYTAGAVVILALLITGINMFNSNMKINEFDKSLADIAEEISNLSDEKIQDKYVQVNNMAGGVYPETVVSTESNINETKSVQTVSSSIGETENLQSQKAEDESAASESGKESEKENSSQGEEPENVSYDIYIVESGDTLLSICKKIYGNLDKYNEVISINNLQDVNYLYVGQEIKLP